MTPPTKSLFAKYKSAHGGHFDLFELTIKWAMTLDRSFLISVSISLIVRQSDFKIECKFHWNRTTDEPGVPSSATRSFAPSWKWSLMAANLVKMMTLWWDWSWAVSLSSILAFRFHFPDITVNIKTYWPAGGGRGQNPENTAQGHSGHNSILQIPISLEYQIKPPPLKNLIL